MISVLTVNNPVTVIVNSGQTTEMKTSSCGDKLEYVLDVHALNVLN